MEVIDLFNNHCFKASETLLGIETVASVVACLTPSCFKASETLLGIETRT